MEFLMFNICFEYIGLKYVRLCEIITQIIKINLCDWMKLEGL